MGERTCRFCGCTEMRACWISDDPCGWIAEDVCSNPVCDAALNERLVEQVAELLDVPPGVTFSREEAEAAKALEIVQLVARCVGGHIALDGEDGDHG